MFFNKSFVLTIKSFLFAVTIFCAATQIQAATRTWDGGGATNNFSEAANWTDDTAPTSADDAVFNSTSTKNAIIDGVSTVANFSINSGYSGIITQTAVLNVGNTFTQSAGIFQGTAANATFGVLILNAGGNFVAPSGTLEINSQIAYYIFDFNGGTFNANGGTFNANGRPDTNYFRGLTPTFNNLIFSKPVAIIGSPLIVNGNLTLASGADLQSNYIQANGNVSFADGANSVTGGSTEIRFSDAATRTATISGTTISLPIVINNPGVTVTTSATSGTVTWNKKVTLQAGKLQQTAANYVFNVFAGFNNPGFDVIGGTFQGGAGSAVFNTSIGISSGSLNGGTGDLGTNAANCPAFPQSNYFFQQSGGTFNGGAGNARFCDLRRTGGNFTAPSGNLTILNFGDFAGGTFGANNGTLIIENNASINVPGFALNNVTLLGANGHGISGTPKPQINGNLNLAEGAFSSGDVAANGDVIYGANFTGGGGRLFFEGTSTRTINLPARNILLGMTLDNPNVTVTTSGAGASIFTGGVEVKRGLLQQGAAVLNFGATGLTVAGGTFQGSAAELNPPGIIVSAGALQGGTGLITTSTFIMTGGAFSSGGDVNLSTYQQSGGIFNAPSGLLTVIADFSSTAGTFNAGTGTVKFTGYNTFNCINSIVIDVATTITFNNLNIANSFCNQRRLLNGDTLIVSGDFRLSAGGLNAGRIRPLGTTTIDASYNGYGGSTIVEYVTPNTNFVINNPASTVNMMITEFSAANSTLTSSGAGRINFVGLTLTDGTVNQGAGIWDITNPGYAQSGGTFNGGAAELFLANGAGNPVLTGGVFNGGTGKITGGFRVAGGTMSIAGDLDSSNFSLEGGIFNAPLGVMSIGQGFSHVLGGTFNARTGTVQTSTAFGTFGVGFNVNAAETFHNLRFNGTNNNANHGIGAGDVFTVNGTLTFSGRGVSGGSIIANGNVVYENYGAYQNATTLVRFEDNFSRVVTLCGADNCSGGLVADIQPTLVNNPNITINTGLTANGVMNFASLDLRRGVFNQNDGRVTMNVFNQSGGTFNGGTFSAATNLNSFGNFTLSGGDFNAAPTMTLAGNFTHTAGGNFNEGAGTIYFSSTFNGANGIVDVDGSETFNNVRFLSGNGTNIAAGDVLVINGTTTLQAGTINVGTLDVKGDVNALAANFGGNFQGGSANVIFSGASDQIFTNPSGFPTFGGSWTVNKQTAFTNKDQFAPDATSILFLNGNVGAAFANSYPTLNLVGGIVAQGANANLFLGATTIAAGTTFANLENGDLTLNGNLTNDGLINFNGDGTTCPQPDSILIRSSVAGTQRAWSGAGTFRLIDVDVKDQSVGATPGTMTTYSSTNGGNNLNWFFDSTCGAATAATATVSGRVTAANGNPIAKVRVTITGGDGIPRQTMTNAFGYYRFAEVATGDSYVVRAVSKRYSFVNAAQFISVNAEMSDVNFTAYE